MDYGGWFDCKEKAFHSIVDVQFLSAMGPPGGGRNSITSRFMRHFQLISVTTFSDSSLSKIFSSILSWFLRRFPSSYAALSSQVLRNAC